MKRPLMPVALFYGGGLLIAEFSQPSLPLLFVLSFGLAATAIFISSLRRHLLWPLIFCLAWTDLVGRTSVISPRDWRVTQTNSAEIVSIQGKLLERPNRRVLIRGEEES